jgi:hypothetical protein
MTFETAGEITVLAMVDAPLEEVERGEAFDYHQEEHEGEAGSGEAAAGAGSGD